jgi:transposase, IS5 family
MALRKITHEADIDLFRQELVNLVDLRHALCALAGKIDWKALETKFGSLYATGVGRPGHPIRLMVGLQLLKYLRNIYLTSPSKAKRPLRCGLANCPRLVRN